MQAGALHDGDDEEAQEHVPQIEGQLSTHVGTEVAILDALILVVGVDAEGLLLVDVGLTHRDGDREHGDVHHDQVGDLDGGVQVGKVDDRKPSRASRRGLEEAV